jgi:hypothetical protein
MSRLLGNNIKTYSEFLASPPDIVSWSEVVEFTRWNDRRSCIDVFFANLLGVCDGYVEWCPDGDPPSSGLFPLCL